MLFRASMTTGNADMARQQQDPVSAGDIFFEEYT